MKVRDILPLVGIAVAAFVFNMSEFMPIGLLTGIATDFGITEPEAGLIISIYAWAVAILSLPLMLLLRKMEYRKMLLLCVVVFAFFQFLSGVSANYAMLMVCRLGVASAHAVFWSIAAPLAVRVVDSEHEKLALSAIATGTSVAMIAGLPIGRIIGLALGWRSTFIVIAVITLALLLLLATVFPRVENPGTFTVDRVPEIFRNKVIISIYIALVVFVVGNYTVYSYIEPFMLQIASLSDATITVALIIFGVAGIAGSVIYTRTPGGMRFGVVFSAVAGVCAASLILRPAADFLPALIGVIILWGICNAWFNISFQNELIKASPSDAVPIAMSLFSGIYNVGIASGSIIGGMVINSLGIGNIGFIGGAIIVGSLLFTGLVLIKLIKKRESAIAE